MRVGVPKETSAAERRVALVPDVIARLDAIEAFVERGAGANAGFPDDTYADAGATLVDDAWVDVEVVAKVAKPTGDEASRMS